MLAFIERLEHSKMVGVNPEVAHDTMAGLSFLHGVAQALWAGKLFHIDLNAQRVGRYDQDFRFGAVGLKDAFFLVKLLEDSGYDGPRHFDAKPLRVEAQEGVWDFAAGCMRTYLALKERASRWGLDADIAAAEVDAKVAELALDTIGPYSPERADELLAEQHDLDALGARECGNERLDQLAVDLILGLR
jgi:xylose isomerase